MHDHGQPTRKRHDGLFHPAVPGDFLRGEFSRLVAAKDSAAITSTSPELWPERVDLRRGD
jgi:hypothetical protein